MKAGGYSWDSTAQTTVTPFTATTPVGVDNSQLLPPTVSTKRGEDTLFSVMIAALYPDTVHWEFSWGQAHVRTPKDWAENTFEKPAPLYFMRIIWRIVELQVFPAAMSVVEKMKALAAACHQLADQTDGELEAVIRETWYEGLMGNIDAFNTRLELLTDEEQGCKQDIQRIIDIDMAALSKGQFPEILDAPGVGIAAALDLVRKGLRDYADALVVWPELWHYCRQNPSVASTSFADQRV